MRLPETHRGEFAKPMGTLIPDDAVSPEVIRKVASDRSPVVTVGDRTTERMLGYSIPVDLQIVDGVEQRMARPAPGDTYYTIRCDNPASCITQEAVSAIRRGYDIQKPVRILVSGEEDLLLLPALIYAPEGAVLLYGQPNQGVVVVYADYTSKCRGWYLMDLLEGDDETVAD